jgi:hypothetical protein
MLSGALASGRATHARQDKAYGPDEVKPLVLQVVTVTKPSETDGRGQDPQRVVGPVKDKKNISS